MFEPVPQKRPPPFSIRLSADERVRLQTEAAGVPLGSYIKAKLLKGAPLGQSRYASNLNQIAHAANLGSLVFSEEEQVALQEALQHVAEIRAILLKATGIRKDA